MLPRFYMNNEDEDDGVFAISFVDKGAMERPTIMLKKEVNLAVDKVKKTIYGAIMVPEKVIYRNPIAGFEDGYEIVFSKEAIKNNQLDYARDGFNDQVTLQHNSGGNKSDRLEDVVLFSNWLVQDSEIDTSIALGLGELPVGTWVGGFHVDNDELLEKLANGEANEFSIEGGFTPTEANLQSEAMLCQGELCTMDNSDDEKIANYIVSQENKSEDEIIKELTEFLNKK